ncbi:hypothetical protein BDW75DRAFT_226467 [Aspergillus navahoensis]
MLAPFPSSNLTILSRPFSAAVHSADRPCWSLTSILAPSSISRLTIASRALSANVRNSVSP